MGFTVQLSNEDYSATISTDEHPHPDLMDSMVSRCEKLFLTTWLALPDPPEETT